MRNTWYLSPLEIIETLSQEERELFYRKACRNKYPKGTLVFSPGDLGGAIFYVMSGGIKIFNMSSCGKEVIYWFCYPRDFFGLAEVCGGEKRTVFAEAAEDSELLSLSGKDFEAFLGRNPQVALLLMRVLGRRLRQAHETIKELIACDVYSRLAQLLLKLGQICGASCKGAVVLEKKFTHQEMASMIGATRTTVTEVLNEFKKKGFIETRGGRITILDRESLAVSLDTPDED